MAPIDVESSRGQDESTIDDINRTHTSSVKPRLLFVFPFDRCFWLSWWESEASTRSGPSIRHRGKGGTLNPRFIGALKSVDPLRTLAPAFPQRQLLRWTLPRGRRSSITYFGLLAHPVQIGQGGAQAGVACSGDGSPWYAAIPEITDA
jgi:hypothetical protein